MIARLNLRPTRNEIRYFGVTLAILAVIAGLLFTWWHSLTAGLWVGGLGLAAAVISYLLPWLGRWVFILWSVISFALSWVISPLVIGLIYFLFLTPLGILYRLLGRDVLCLRKPKSVDSYFAEVNHTFSRSDFDHQF